MVYVEGYTFTMRCTEEYDSDAYYNEITNSDSGYILLYFCNKGLFKTFKSRCGVNTIILFKSISIVCFVSRMSRVYYQIEFIHCQII